MKTVSGLPRHTSNSWIVGWKVANLVRERQRRNIAFTQVHQDGDFAPYWRNDEAKCCRKRYWEKWVRKASQNPDYEHIAPEEGCRCGFNAFETESQAREYAAKMLRVSDKLTVVHNLVLMRVGLYGTVLDGTYETSGLWGYKAQFQQVAQVFVPRECGLLYCRRPAEVLGVPLDEWAPRAYRGFDYLRPLCNGHRLDGRPLDLAEVARIIGSEVRWDAQGSFLEKGLSKLWL